MPWKRSKSPDYAPERLTDLYNQLQDGMPLLRDIVQPEAAQEGTALYASGGGGPPYRFEKRGKESWAVLDCHAGDALVVLTKYKKGAQAVMERLEASERCIADLSHSVEGKPSCLDGRKAPFHITIGP